MVFTAGRGTLLDQRSMLRKFYPILKAAALPRIRFKDLRHSAATLLLAQGVQPALHHGTVWALLDQPDDEHVRARSGRDET
jgi:integrase